MDCDGVVSGEDEMDVKQERPYNHVGRVLEVQPRETAARTMSGHDHDRFEMENANGQ